MKKILCLASTLLIFSCAFPSTKEGMKVMDYKSSKKIGEKIFVKESKGGSSTLPFWTSEISNDNFTTAVKDSLLASKTFSALANNWDEDWGLEIEIIDVDQPMVGVDMTVATNIKYTLYFKGKKTYEISVHEKGKATMNDTFFAVKRLRLANEKSAKKNIEKFISDLEKAKIPNQ